MTTQHNHMSGQDQTGSTLEVQLPEVFADGVKQISFSSGVFRMEIASLGPVQDETQQTPPPLRTKMRLLMPVDGFVQLLRSMEDIFKQLVDAGVLRPQQNSNGQSRASAVNASAGDFPAAQPKPKSSNFD